MQITRLKYIIILLFLLGVSHHTLWAQASAEVTLNRSSVYVQQPFRVTITVYTKTWFTQPPTFGNLQIPNAFIVPFDKTQPGMFTIGGKQYPGIQFYYIVFPYKAGNFTVPSLEITVESPPEGSSQAVKRTLNTTPQPFTVKDVPDNLKEQGTWFVAKHVTLSEHWEPAGKTYKVGDVVKRTVTIDAAGTLPQFIPDLNEQEVLKWASSYPQDPVVTDTREGGDIDGKSVQAITYLMEKEGDFTIPAITLSYWNPYTFKTEKATTNPINIHVNENPDLGILQTLKDSLDLTLPTGGGTSSAKKGPFLILGMKWYIFAGWSVAGLILLWFTVKYGKQLYKYGSSKRKRYLKSEKHLFRRFLKSDGNPNHFLKALYGWWDTFSDKTSASVGYSLGEAKDEEGSKTVKKYFEQTEKGESPQGAGEIKKTMARYRNKKNKPDTEDDNYFPV